MKWTNYFQTIVIGYVGTQSSNGLMISRIELDPQRRQNF